MRPRPKPPHEIEICPGPLVSIKEATKWEAPTTEEGWKALEKIKKIDLNDLSHKFGLTAEGDWDAKLAHQGMMKWLDESPTYWVGWEPYSDQIVSTQVLMDCYEKLREPVIHGLLRNTETMNIIAPPKAGKSWMGLNIAINIIGGGKIFDKFKCEQGRVLIIDNELHCETIAQRVRDVAQALNMPNSVVGEHLHFLPLRGRCVSLEQLTEKLQYVRPGSYKTLIIDPAYKLYPVQDGFKRFDENSNTDMAHFYTLLEDLADSLDTAIILIHHSSKGSQSSKSITDLGAGAGAQARACDTHLALRDHEQPGIFVIESANRSFGPIAPFCARFKWPKWELADNYSPDDLKGIKKKGPGSTMVGGDKQRPMTREEKKADSRRRSIEFVLTETVVPKSEGEILNNGKTTGLYPWNRFSLHLLIEELLKDGKIKVSAKGAGQVATKYISCSAPPQSENPQPVASQSSYDGYTADFESKTVDEEFSSEDYENDTNDEVAPF